MSLREKFWKSVEDDVIKLLQEFHNDIHIDTFESRLSNETIERVMRSYAKKIISHVMKGHD